MTVVEASLQHISILLNVKLYRFPALGVTSSPQLCLWRVKLKYILLLLSSLSSVFVSFPPCVPTALSSSPLPHQNHSPALEQQTKTQTQLGNLWVKPARWRQSQWLEGGIPENGQIQFYCYLPKTVNYIWSLMWNLFCRLSVNKLCGSLQAAYLTFSVHFPHTGSATLTRAESSALRIFTGKGTRSFQSKATKESLIIFTTALSNIQCQKLVESSTSLTRCMALLCSLLTSTLCAKLKIPSVCVCVCSSTIQGVKTESYTHDPSVCC